MSPSLAYAYIEEWHRREKRRQLEKMKKKRLNLEQRATQLRKQKAKNTSDKYNEEKKRMDRERDIVKRTQRLAK